MKLIVRDEFFELPQTKFQTIAEGEGHCVFNIEEIKAVVDPATATKGNRGNYNQKIWNQ
jgi:hypothetical protein